MISLHPHASPREGDLHLRYDYPQWYQWKLMDPLSLSIKDTVDVQLRAKAKTSTDRWNHGRMERQVSWITAYFFSIHVSACRMYVYTYIFVYIYILRRHINLSRNWSTLISHALSSNRRTPWPVSRYNRHFSSDRTDSSLFASEVPRQTRYLHVTCPILRTVTRSRLKTTNLFYVPTIPTTRDLVERASITRESWCNLITNNRIFYTRLNLKDIKDIPHTKKKNLISILLISNLLSYCQN